MSREIKFRLWSHKKKMIPFIDLTHWTFEDIETVNKGESGSVLMQFTGFKDKTGIDIYDGDFFQYFNRKGIIKYSEFSPQFVLFSGENEIPIDKYILRDLVIIGNIYENPELLK